MAEKCPSEQPAYRKAYRERKSLDASWLANDRDKKKRAAKLYYAANRAAIKRRAQIYYLKNKEKIKATVDKYRINNPDKIKALKRKCYYKDIERSRARQRELQRQYRERDPARFRAYVKRWRANNPGKDRMLHRAWMSKQTRLLTDVYVRSLLRGRYGIKNPTKSEIEHRRSIIMLKRHQKWARLANASHLISNELTCSSQSKS